MIPAEAVKLGASIPTAGLLAGLFMLGTLLAGPPASHLVYRLGERRAMITTALLAASVIALTYFVDNLFSLGFATLIAGSCSSVFGLARHGYMAHNVPMSHRARSLSTLGGMFRGGGFLGPALASAVIVVFNLHAVLLVATLFCLLAALVLIITRGTGFEDDKPLPLVGMWSVVKSERHKLITLGSAAAILSSVRTVRSIGVPLWALNIHLHPGTTTLFIAIAGAVDFALFYSSGQVMDKFGRRAAAVPTLLATGLVFSLAFLAQDAAGFLTICIGLALANGIGSGVIMVIGADLAPAKTRNEFLASFRMMNDASQASTGPILSLLTATVGITAAFSGFGILAFCGAWLMFKYIPRFERN